MRDARRRNRNIGQAGFGRGRHNRTVVPERLSHGFFEERLDDLAELFVGAVDQADTRVIPSLRARFLVAAAKRG